MIFIAELCQNHNGDVDLMKKMAYEAKEAGSDYAKIQTIFADMVAYRERFEDGLIENGEQKTFNSMENIIKQMKAQEKKNILEKQKQSFLPSKKDNES